MENRIIEEKGNIIVNILAEFDVKVEIANTLVGPSVVQYQLKLAPKTKISKITSLIDELTLALAAEVPVRIEPHIPGLPYIGIEIANPTKRAYSFEEVIKGVNPSAGDLPIPLGLDINSKVYSINLEEMPHLLVAGTTGSGKSVFINNCIISLMKNKTPEEVKFILIDPKMVEFAAYKKSKYLFTSIANDPTTAMAALEAAIMEMDHRLTIFSAVGVASLAEYNRMVMTKDRMPRLVVVIDELADLMLASKKAVEKNIVRLAQKARAAGIHLILATQRPQATVITGLIKANIPARIAFSLPSKLDSRLILGTGGAETLNGKGDMLFLNTSSPNLIRLQGAIVSEKTKVFFANK